MDAACNEAESLLEQASHEQLDETVRREVVRGLVSSLTEIGFILEGPRLADAEKKGGVVTLTGKLPSGRAARFEVHIDGRMHFDFDGYEGRSCANELENVERVLRERCSLKLGPTQVTWKNTPLQRSRGARELPTGCPNTSSCP